MPKGSTSLPREAVEVLGRAQLVGRQQVHLVLIAPRGDLPFRDGCFDAVITTEVIEHVPDDRKTIGELARVLVPGGLLILSTPHRHWLSFLDLGNLKFRFPRLHRFLLTCLGRVSDAAFENRYGGQSGLIGDVSVQANAWHRHYSLGQLQALLADLFQIERYYVFGPMARLLWPAGTAVGRIAPPLGRWLKRADHASRRHFASQGFDMCIVARRCAEGEPACP